MSREYSNRRENIQMDHKDFNIKTTAVAAAITSEHGMLLWRDYGKSVVTDDFLDFLKRVKATAGKRKIALILDNLNVHKTLVVRNYCAAADLTLIFNAPAYP